MLTALILLDATTCTTPGAFQAKQTQNALAAMGIRSQFRMCNATTPAVAVLNADTSIDMLVTPVLDGSNRAALQRFIDGSVTKPVFVQGLATTNAAIKGVTTTYADASALFTESWFSANPATKIWDNTRRFSKATLAAPIVCTPIIEGVGDVTPQALVAWSYTPDGVNHVYYSASTARYSHLPILIQRAINDGHINSTDVKRAPIILTIDHINAGGDTPTTALGGFQAQPENIATLGAILRSANAVCYSSLERKWIYNTSTFGAAGVTDAGTAGPYPLVDRGYTTGTLLANLREYDGEFKYISGHDHQAALANGTTPWVDDTAGYLKSDNDLYYQVTKTAIESLGLTVTTDLCHFSNSRAGSNFWKLASREVSVESDPLNATVKAGYGFRMARVGTAQTESWPRIHYPSTSTAVPPVHWMLSPTKIRGITMHGCIDIGSRNVNTDGSGVLPQTSAFGSYSTALEQFSSGISSLFHDTDFEDTSLLGGHSTESPSHVATYGVMCWQLWAGLQTQCPDTVNFGADITEYVK